jgi:hypothetical protein
LRDRRQKFDPERRCAIDEVLRRQIRTDHAGVVEVYGGLGQRARLHLVEVPEDDWTVRPLHGALAGRAERPLPDIDARIGQKPGENEQNEIVPRLIRLQRRQVIFDEIARLHAQFAASSWTSPQVREVPEADNQSAMPSRPSIAINVAVKRAMSCSFPSFSAKTSV